MRLGSDPEVFLRNSEGKHLSIIGKIGAGKWNPKQIDGLPQGFTLQEDNVALEFGVPPAASSEEFVKNIRTVLQAGLKNLPGTRFSRLSCTIFPEDQMQHPSAFVFGCEPDFNAWTGQENTHPVPPHQYMRSAGGHVHIETDLEPRNVVRCCDLFLGVPSVLMDSGNLRRQLYGKAGAYRPKPYGVEYRVLSNFWIFKKQLIEWVWTNTELALNLCKTNPDWGNGLGLDIQDAINTGNKQLAQALVNEFNIPVLQ